MAKTPEVDPWLDTEFGQVDFNTYREDKMLEPDTSTVMIQPDFGNTPAEPVVETPEPVVELAPAPEPIAEPVELDTPETIELDGGGHITLEKKKGQWCASVDVGTGGIQNFYGKTKNELLMQAFKAQANATKKIRDLNRQVKLGTGKESPAPIKAAVAPRQLSADEIFSIKTKFESNPDEALEEWFKAKTGRSVIALAEQADRGVQASTELSTEAVNKAFIAAHPGYYADENYENFTSLVAYIAKNQVGRTLTPQNKEAIYEQLQSEGHWTVQNLDEAYEELNEAGLLITPRRRPEVTVEKQPATPPAPPTDPRIVSRVVQPRPGLGLKQTEATPVRAEAPKPPSVEDFDSMTDEQIKNLLHQTLRLKQQSRR